MPGGMSLSKVLSTHCHNKGKGICEIPFGLWTNDAPRSTLNLDSKQKHVGRSPRDDQTSSSNVGEDIARWRLIAEAQLCVARPGNNGIAAAMTAVIALQNHLLSQTMEGVYLPAHFSRCANREWSRPRKYTHSRARQRLT